MSLLRCAGRPALPCVCLLALALCVSASPADGEWRPVRLLQQHLNVRLDSPDTLPALRTAASRGSELSLPPGEHVLGGVRWQIAGKDGFPRAILLGGPPPGTDRLEEVPVERRATELRFLHAFEPGPALDEWAARVALQKRKSQLPPEPPVLFRYRIRYADGRVLDVPVRWGEGLGAMFRTGPVAPMLWARPAWVEELSPQTTEKLVLYEMRWPNPRPEVEITSMDLISGNSLRLDYGAAVVAGLAISDGEQTGRAFYVQPSPKGHDEAPGTFDRPWATVQRAAEALEPGDIVYLRAGTYPITHEIVPAHSGTEDKWITYSAYPGETPVIDAHHHGLDASRPGPPFDHDGGAFQLVQRGFIRVQGLQVQSSHNSGFNVRQGHDIELLHNRVFRTFNSGIGVFNTRRVRVVGNTVVQPTSREMHPGPTGSRSLVFHPPHESITMGPAYEFEVAFNEIYASDKEGVDCKGACRSGEVHHNYIHSTLAVGIYVDSWSGLIQDIDVHHNTIHDAGGIVVASEGHTPVDDVRIHHNLIYNNHSNGVDLAAVEEPAKKTNLSVTNNTLYHNGYGFLRRGWFGGGLILRGHHLWDVQARGNIIVDNAMAQIADQKLDYQAHRITVEHNMITPWIHDTGHHDRLFGSKGEEAIEAEPSFVDPAQWDFRLRPDSPAVDVLADQTDPDGSDGDLGALPLGRAITPGRDPFAGRILAYWQGDWRCEPVLIPDRLRNGYVYHRHQPAWFWGDRKYTPDMRAIPSGYQSLRGVTYFIPDHNGTPGPTVCMLSGRGSYATAGAVRGIPVGRKAEALFFLHTACPGPRVDRWRSQGAEGEPPVVFRYIVHYTDGATESADVRWDREVADWQAADDPTDLPGAKAAWTQKRRVGRGETRHLAAYAMRWDNPRPDARIASVDMVRPEAGGDYGGAALLAITAAELQGQSAGVNGQSSFSQMSRQRSAMSSR